MNPPRKRKQARHGFTLLEALVTIAILLVLVGMIFPIASRMRESSRNSQCIAHLRQAGVAMQHYISEMGNRIVTRRGGNRGGSTDLWGAELSGRGYLSEPARKDGYRSTTGSDPRLLQCPTGALPPSFSMTNWSWYTYGINLFTPGLKSTEEKETPLSVRNVMTIQSPAKFPLLADSASGTDNVQYFRLSSDNGGLALRHSGKGNVLFLDGHVEAIGRKEAQALGFPDIHSISP